MAFRLYPPVSVQDGEACKRPGQSDIPAWKAAHSCPEQINTVDWQISFSSCWLSWWCAGRRDVNFLCWSAVSFVATWSIYHFFQDGGKKRGPEIAGGAVEEHGFPSGLSHWGPFFTERKKLIWACSNPSIRLPFSTKVAAPWLYLTPSETKWTCSNRTSLTPDRSIPMGI